MSFKNPELPYAFDALAPYISPETLDFHYNKHHTGYFTKLNSLVDNTPLKDVTLEELLKGDTSKLSKGVLNSAGQAWNHTFYWNSLAPVSAGGGGAPSGAIEAAIVKSFGSVDKFKTQFSDSAAGHFGSGWAWLVQEKSSGLLKIVDTHDAGTPLSNPELTPILTCDVWEHAYYIDYRNARAKYIDGKECMKRLR